MKQEKKIWFKAKLYGYGWYPSTKEGYITLILFLAFVFLPSIFLPKHSDDLVLLLAYLGYVGVLTLILLKICIKHGEEAKWRWGK